MTAGADPDDDALRRADAAGVPVSRVSERVAAALSETRHPQGVIAVVDLPDIPLDAVLSQRARLVVVLVGAADPGNAGTVIRTADAAGADAVIVTRGSVDPFGGKCVRASAGSIFHVPVVTGVELGATITALREAGLQVLATTLDGADLDSLAVELTAPTAWLFGSEAHGLETAGVDGADLRVRIPMHGRAESLNLATAAALCLYASARAQRG
ncbi:MAG: methyltransferase, TrmH family [Frankiaceae bacterium]|nr:methyltransferase, TrmH family [Frankiaceae bacterium]